MTEQEYLDPQRFPLTTQRGISPQGQRMIDAHNFDELQAAIEQGEQLDADQQGRMAELRQKLGR